MKTILFNLKKLPYSSIEQEENLEMILFSTSYGWPTAVLFSEQAVWQLLADQSPPPGSKNLAKMIASFQAFEIESIYACQEDVLKAGLVPSSFVISPQLISNQEICSLKRQYDIVIEM